jgi:hypothetical protein
LPIKTKTARSQQTKSGILDDAKPVAKVKKGRSFCIYGPAGTGKTTLAASLPKPILYLDVSDRGTDSIADVEDIFVKEVETMADFEDIYWALKEQIDDGDCKYKSIVIDTVTNLQTQVVKEFSDGNKKKKGTRAAGDWGTMTQRDWGDVSGWLKFWLTNYRDLGLNVMFIAQHRTFNTHDDDEGNVNMLAPEVGPALSPATAKALNAAVTFVGNMHIRHFVKVKEVNGKKKKVERMAYCLGVGPDPVYARKVRKPKGDVPPDYIEDPTYDDLIAIIKGTK